jgi:hypothetical protein
MSDNLLIAALFLIAMLGLILNDIFGEEDKKKDEQRSCVVLSTNITLIPARPNTVTILRNGTREVCYIYKETPDADMSN